MAIKGKNRCYSEWQAWIALSKQGGRCGPFPQKSAVTVKNAPSPASYLLTNEPRLSIDFIVTWLFNFLSRSVPLLI